MKSLSIVLMGLLVVPAFGSGPQYPDVGLFNPHNSLFKRGARQAPEVALTFDDGPHVQSTKRILEILRQYKVHATFFVVGEKVDEQPELAKAILHAGCELGNHTMTHPRLDTLTAPEIRQQLLDCQSSVAKATGRSMNLMRPPGMRFNHTVLQTAHNLGYYTIGWNVGAKDFIVAGTANSTLSPMDSWLEPHGLALAQRVLGQVKHGDIILLHDAADTADALPAILFGLKRMGYSVETVTEMMRQLPEPINIEANPPVGKRSHSPISVNNFKSAADSSAVRNKSGRLVRVKDSAI
ncbi:hypothetical protein BH11ARM1_BH11ARM1_09210 [soil metagenome]